MKIEIIECNRDNYSYLIQKEDKGIIIDPGNYDDIKAIIKNCDIEYILLTHNHSDHSEGVPVLLKKYPKAEIINYQSNINKIFDYNLKILQTPGHTKDSCCFYFTDSKKIFTGDTLFTSCCGRIKDGTYKELHESLKQIMMLPHNTIIYPGHEYLKQCLGFIEYIKGNIAEYKKYFSKRFPSVEVYLKDELKNNPFLTRDYEVFKKYRELKNSI